MGVPTIGCDCQVCKSVDPHDRRTRPSVLVQYEGRNILIDTTPDFREQALRSGITHLDAVLYTHSHADHILGLDDLRPVTFRHSSRVPLYASAATAASLRSVFAYIFEDNYKFGNMARVEILPLGDGVELFGARFRALKVVHGDAEIDAFRFGSAAYLTDVSSIPDASMAQLQGLDVLFLDALRRKPHPTHSTVDQALTIVERLKPKRTFFTHISHDLPHKETNAGLPPNVQLAHDGLKVEFEI
jgi:phosphoribosyl 1,2-cyclic phosphate phosphodiesterase